MCSICCEFVELFYGRLDKLEYLAVYCRASERGRGWGVVRKKISTDTRHPDYLSRARSMHARGATKKLQQIEPLEFEHI